MKAFRVSLAAAIVWVLHSMCELVWNSISSQVLSAISQDYTQYLIISGVAGGVEIAVTLAVLVLSVIALALAAQTFKRDVEDRQKIWSSVALGIALVLVILCCLSTLSSVVSTVITYINALG